MEPSKKVCRTPLVFGFIGYGKMAKAIDLLAKEKGYPSVVATRNDYETKRETLAKCDLLFDFSESKSVLSHILDFIPKKVPMVIGTTGWDDQVAAAKEAVLRNSGSLFYAPNFSIGLFLFSKVLEHTSKLFSTFPEFDVGGYEIHHRHKKDAPSGTMKMLSTKISADELPVGSVRIGHFPGTHTLIYDAEEERVTLTHESKSRKALAKGALAAAEWLIGKEGFFTMEDLCGTE